MISVSLTDNIAVCHTLRRTVFIDEQGVSEAEEIDGYDGDALHLLACADGTPVGTARLLIKGDVAKIGRVCVLRSHRGRGLGAALIRAALVELRRRPDLRVARLGSQVHVIRFYEKLGFVAHGPIYDDAGIDHRDMDCPL